MDIEEFQKLLHEEGVGLVLSREPRVRLKGTTWCSFTGNYSVPVKGTAGSEGE